MEEDDMSPPPLALPPILCWTLLAALTLAAAAYAAAHLFFLPMDRVRTVEQVGFAHVEGGSARRKRMWVNRLRRWRKAGRAPPPYPNGWYAIFESRQLRPGTLKHLSALGLNLAVFRGRDSGRVFVTGAYCPHLGANVAVGGRVLGDCVECPFHEWVFSGEDGRCQGVPYLAEGSKVPDFARLDVYPTAEMNGLVYLWYHAEGDPPGWHPEEEPELNGCSSWVYQGRNEFEVACHIQDIPENGADVAHLPAVHKTNIFAGGEPGERLQSYASRFCWHEWSVRWRPGHNDCDVDGGSSSSSSHLATVDLSHGLRLRVPFLESNLELLSMRVRGLQVGPALVHLRFDCPGVGMGRGVMLQCVLPMEPMLQRVVHVFYTERKFTAPMAKLVLYGESILFERDVRVWNSKTYQDHPQLVKEDQLVRKHRRWYDQFYSSRKKRKGRSNSADSDTIEW